jgi:hypothetical protein
MYTLYFANLSSPLVKQFPHTQQKIGNKIKLRSCNRTETIINFLNYHCIGNIKPGTPVVLLFPMPWVASREARCPEDKAISRRELK